jgi:hypothetical protein
MMRLLISASIIVFTCAVASAGPATERGALASSGKPSFEDALAFRAKPLFMLGAPFSGTVFSSAAVLPVMPGSLQYSPELFAPVLTGSRELPAAPVLWAGDSDYGLAGRFIATMNRYAGPRDALQPSDLGIRAALNGPDPKQPSAEWVPVRQHVEQQMIEYAFDFGAEDLTGAVADNQRVMALLGWKGGTDVPVVAQGE